MSINSESDILYDPHEESIFARRTPSLTEVFKFMGWRFHVRRTWRESVELVTLCCYKTIINPFPEGAIHSFCTLANNSLSPVPLPQKYFDLMMKEKAAWLIAHWWEHYLQVCPCQDEDPDDKPSNFRNAVIGSLLWYDQCLHLK